MKVVFQEAHLIEQEKGLTGIYKQIEQAARTCYQSYANIKEDSAEIMVNGLIKRNHTAMLEHGTVYLEGPENDCDLKKYIPNPYSRYRCVGDTLYITTNYRVIVENGWKKDLKKYLCDRPSEHHIKRYTVRMTTNMQVATECLRHRKMSFAMESSRYCAYDLQKFGNELTFIFPAWLNDCTKAEVIEWTNAMQDAENHYMRARMNKWAPEMCAQYLPKAAKTTLVMTGFEDDWQHFFNLRYHETTGPVHPQMKEIATIVYNLIGKEIEK